MNTITLFNKFHRQQAGQLFIMVLIFLAFGSIVIGPLMGYIGSGLKAGQAFETKTKELYAADAGIEDAIWHIKTNGEFLSGSIYVNNEFFNVTGHLPPYALDVNGDGINEEYDYLYYTIYSINQDDWDVQVRLQRAVGNIFYIQSWTPSDLFEYFIPPDNWAGTEIETFINYLPGGAIAEGGEGGEYEQNENMKGLSLIDEDVFIFSVSQSAQFKAKDDLTYSDTISTEDLYLVNMDDSNEEVTSGWFFKSNDHFIDNKTNYAISGIHYYQESGNDYLLLNVEDNGTINDQTFSKSDIIRLEVTIDTTTDPDHPMVTSVDNIATFHTIEGASIVGLGVRSNKYIISLHSTYTIGGEEYNSAEVIEYDPDTQTAQLLFDSIEILGTPPGGLEIDCLAPLLEPDERVLISFKVNGSINDSNGDPIYSEDIAIWNPDDNTINIHIGMRGQDGMMSLPIYYVIVESWNIN